MGNPREIPLHEAFQKLMDLALANAAEKPDDLTIPRAFMGVTLQVRRHGDQELKEWALFCHSHEYPLVTYAIDEMQRVRKLCFDNGINPDLD